MTEVISRAVVVDDLLITELKDGAKAQDLSTEGGVRRHFNIPYCDMPYYITFRDDTFGGRHWHFSSKPFKGVKI